MEREFTFNRSFGVEIDCIHKNVLRSELVEFLAAAGVVAEAVVGETTPTQLGSWKILYSDSIITNDEDEMATALISPKLFGKDGLEEINKVLTVLNDNGIQVNESCGLRIHQDASDFNWEDAQKLAKLVLGFETTIFQLVPSYRRGNDTCKEAKVSKIIPLFKAKTGVQFQKAWFGAGEEEQVDITAKNDETHNHGLNLFSFWHRGTIEFRYFESTLDFDTVKAWIVLTAAMTNFAKESKTVKYEKVISPKSIKFTENVNQARLYTLLDYINLLTWDDLAQGAKKKTFQRLEEFGGLPRVYSYPESEAYYSEFIRKVTKTSQNESSAAII